MTAAAGGGRRGRDDERAQSAGRPEHGEDVLLVIPAGAAVDVTGEPGQRLLPGAVRRRDRLGVRGLPRLRGRRRRCRAGRSSGPSRRRVAGHAGVQRLQPLQRRRHYQYSYSLDIVRTDGNTAGQPVYSPVDGSIRWTERASGGISINMGNGYAVAIFHITVDPGLRRATVGQGQSSASSPAPGRREHGGSTTSTSPSGRPTTAATGAGWRCPSPARTRSPGWSIRTPAATTSGREVPSRSEPPVGQEWTERWCRAGGETKNKGLDQYGRSSSPAPPPSSHVPSYPKSLRCEGPFLQSKGVSRS